MQNLSCLQFKDYLSRLVLEAVTKKQTFNFWLQLCGLGAAAYRGSIAWNGAAAVGITRWRAAATAAKAALGVIGRIGRRQAGGSNDEGSQEKESCLHVDVG